MKTPLRRSATRSRAATAIRLQPIGVVASPFRTVDSRCDYTAEARHRLYPQYAAGLTGLEYFSHLWIIYHQHRADAWLRARGWCARRPLIVPRDDERAGQGIFSLRAPCRPAGLGSCIVALLRREDDALVVRGLDAIDGTPVVDLKPYVPQFDAFPTATVPRHWARVMDRPDDATHLARQLHWDTTNVDFALGLRAGASALRQLGVERGATLRAELTASAFFAHGFEAATGCSALRGTLKLRARAQRPWRVRLSGATRAVSLALIKTEWADAAAILAAKDAELWAISSRTAGAIRAANRRRQP